MNTNPTSGVRNWLATNDGILALVVWFAGVVYLPVALLSPAVPQGWFPLFFLVGFVAFYRWAVRGGLPPRF